MTYLATDFSNLLNCNWKKSCISFFFCEKKEDAEASLPAFKMIKPLIRETKESYESFQLKVNIMQKQNADISFTFSVLCKEIKAGIDGSVMSFHPEFDE